MLYVQMNKSWKIPLKLPKAAAASQPQEEQF